MDDSIHHPTLRERLKKLYPNLSANELDVAEESLRQYVALTVRMYERLQADADVYQQTKPLTEGD